MNNIFDHFQECLLKKCILYDKMNTGCARKKASAEADFFRAQKERSGMVKSEAAAGPHTRL